MTYKEKVFELLESMDDGDELFIDDFVKPENQSTFIDCCKEKVASIPFGYNHWAFSADFKVIEKVDHYKFFEAESRYNKPIKTKDRAMDEFSLNDSPKIFRLKGDNRRSWKKVAQLKKEELRHPTLEDLHPNKEVMKLVSSGNLHVEKLLYQTYWSAIKDFQKLGWLYVLK